MPEPLEKLSRSTRSSIPDKAGKSRGWLPDLPVFGLMLLIGLLYFVLPNHRYTSDALIAALRMRDATPWFVHPNHILHPLGPQIIHQVAGGKALLINELEILLVWSMIVGILGCWAFVIMLRLGSVSRTTALAGLGFYAFSSAIWYFSVAANPNATALAFHVFGLLAIVYAGTLPPAHLTLRMSVLLGAVIALCIMASQINAILILPLCYLFLIRSNGSATKVRNMATGLVSTGVLTIAIYALIAVAFVRVRTPAEFLQWQHSYVFDQRWWSQDIFDAISRIWVGAVSVPFTSAFYPAGLFGDWDVDPGKPVWYIRFFGRLGQAFVLAFFIVETVKAFLFFVRDRKLLTIQAIGLITSIPLIIFSCFWTPEDVHYRIMYVPGFLMFLMPSIERRYRLKEFRFRIAWPVIAAVFLLFILNLTMQFVPQSNPDNNPYNREINTLATLVDENTFIVFSGAEMGHIRSLYADYFLRCDVITVPNLIDFIRNDPEEIITSFTDCYASGGQVLVHEDAIVNDEDVRAMNELYDIDLRPGEVREFMESFSDIGRAAVHINAKRYYLLTPSENQEGD